ncbi:alpha/beta hydrolase [Nostoc sp. CHAB 5834]|nr:alpha/beta hydrolase [Nostoc sp. CHAB 5834]
MPGSRAAPLLLLPGLLCDARIWPRAALALGGPVVAPMGYGEASTLAEMARSVLQTAPARFSLLGHSMGARVALEIVRAAPERVERLALVSTGVHLLRAGEANSRHALLDIGLSEGAEALVDRWLPPMVASSRRADEDLMAPLRAMCVQAGVETYAAQIAALLHRPEVESLLPGIACPTLVMVGAEDQWSPPEQHRAIAAAIPGAILKIVDGSGHMLPAEAPDAFVAAVADWLAMDDPAIANVQKVA